MKTVSCLLFLVAIIGLAADADAQQIPANGPAERFFPLVARILTEPQRQSLRQIMESQGGRIRPLQEKMRVSREALLDLVVQGKFDESIAEQYAAQSAKAEADLTVLFAKALSQMQPRLSAQQIAELKNFQSGGFRDVRRGEQQDDSDAPAEVHLKLPPDLPRDTNDLPVVN